MDERIICLRTPDDCERFSRNAVRNGRHDLAQQARRRAIELRASSHDAKSQAEKEALLAVYAYEEVLSRRNGRRTCATRTWQMIERRGIIGALEKAVNRNTDAMGYRLLDEMGMKDLAFEAIVLRYPSEFSAEAVAHAKERINSM